MKTRTLTELPTYDRKTGEVNIIIEAPRGSRNKFTYDAEKDLFKLSKTLPLGAVFPFDFGFFPSTLGEDGDPLDVLVFMDEPAFPGNLITARLIGAIQAEQAEEDKTERNDRLIAIATECQDYRNIRELADLPADMVTQIEHFFVSYNQMSGKKFRPMGRLDAKHATKLLETGRKAFEKQRE